jgi:hypothetical protein
MDHRNGVIAVLAMALCLGCASARWSIAKHFWDPGASFKTFPEAVSEEYDCENQKKPFFLIEKNDLLPRKVTAGSDFGHRLVYIMCPNHSTEVVEGRLSRRIRFKGAPVLEKTDPIYELKPGRWAVNAIVHLPDKAEPGIYAYELEFESKSLDFEKSLTFLVEAP